MAPQAMCRVASLEPRRRRVSNKEHAPLSASANGSTAERAPLARHLASAPTKPARGGSDIRPALAQSAEIARQISRPALVAR